jgi:thiol-activated cytolysin
MTSNDPGDGGSDRRQFLAALSTLGAASLAGCSVETPVGDFSADSGEDSTPTSTPEPTAEPTPVETTRPPSPTSAPTPTATPSPSPTPTQPPTPSPTATPSIDIEQVDPDVIQRTPIQFTPIYTDPVQPVQPIDSGGSDGEIGDPSTTSSSGGGVEVAVTPNQRSTGTESLGNQQQTSQNDMVCATEDQRATADGGGLITENLVLNHRLNELWPGAIIPAQSVANGGYGPALSPSRLPDRQPVDVRNPITLTLFTDANRYGSGDPDVSQVVDPPTSNGVEQARVDLLQDVQQGTSAAQLSYDIQQVHSENHLDIQLGVDYNNVATSISGDFSYSRDQVSNRLLVKLYQVYYFMGATFPNPNGAFVTDRSVVEPNDLLISDVSFGRILLFSAESKHTVRDIKASLDATFGGLAGKGEVDLDVKHRRVLDETRIRAQAIGGSASNALQLISDFGEDGLSQIRSYALDGADYGPDSPGAPIGFTARYLNTGDRANTYLTTEYNARTCYPKTRKFRVHNVTLSVQNAGGDGGGNLRLYGDITIKPSHPDDTYVGVVGNAWSRDRDQYVQIDEGNSQTLSDIDFTVEFNVGENRTWTEYMDEASVDVIAQLRERDNLSDDEYQDERKVGSWEPTEPVSRTPTIVFSENNNVVHLTYDVSPVPIQ